MKDSELIAWMDRNNIHKIALWPARRVSVELHDGSFGIDRTITDALAKAKTGEDNVRRAA